MRQRTDEATAEVAANHGNAEDVDIEMKDVSGQRISDCFVKQ